MTLANFRVVPPQRCYEFSEKILAWQAVSLAPRREFPLPETPRTIALVPEDANVPGSSSGSKVTSYHGRIGLPFNTVLNLHPTGKRRTVRQMTRNIMAAFSDFTTARIVQRQCLCFSGGRKNVPRCCARYFARWRRKRRVRCDAEYESFSAPHSIVSKWPSHDAQIAWKSFTLFYGMKGRTPAFLRAGHSTEKFGKSLNTSIIQQQR